MEFWKGRSVISTCLGRERWLIRSLLFPKFVTSEANSCSHFTRARFALVTFYSGGNRGNFHISLLSSGSSDGTVGIKISAPYFGDEEPPSRVSNSLSKELEEMRTRMKQLESTNFVASKLWNARFFVLILFLTFFQSDYGKRDPPGSYYQLWDYEVVELFFLNSKTGRYLELEFGPHGHYLVLLLAGQGNCIKHGLELADYRAQIIDGMKNCNGWNAELLFF